MKKENEPQSKTVIWKLVSLDGIKPNTYEVSNTGLVRNYKTKTIKKAIVNNFGYKIVFLTVPEEEQRVHKQNQKKKLYQRTWLVHRLVMLTFKPEHSPSETQVNHKDENKLNNHLSNLEWMSARDNINYGTAQERHSKTTLNMSDEWRNKLSIAAKNRQNNARKSKRSITLEDLNNRLVYEFETIKAAGIELDINPSKIHYHIKNDGLISDRENKNIYKIIKVGK